MKVQRKIPTSLNNKTISGDIKMWIFYGNLILPHLWDPQKHLPRVLFKIQRIILPFHKIQKNKTEGVKGLHFPKTAPNRRDIPRHWMHRNTNTTAQSTAEKQLSRGANSLHIKSRGAPPRYSQRGGRFQGNVLANQYQFGGEVERKFQVRYHISFRVPHSPRDFRVSEQLSPLSRANLETTKTWFR